MCVIAVHEIFIFLFCNEIDILKPIKLLLSLEVLMSAMNHNQTISYLVKTSFCYFQILDVVRAHIQTFMFSHVFILTS